MCVQYVYNVVICVCTVYISLCIAYVQYVDMYTYGVFVTSKAGCIRRVVGAGGSFTIQRSFTIRRSFTTQKGLKGVKLQCVWVLA